MLIADGNRNTLAVSIAAACSGLMTIESPNPLRKNWISLL